MNASFHSLPGTRYALGRIVGRGGFADVHEGWDRIAGRGVAIKVPRATRDAFVHERLEREGRVGVSIVHENVCRVLDYGVADDDRPFLVLERLVGRTLGAELARAGSLPAGEAVAIVKDLLRGLEATHAAGVLHGDVNPDNVMLLTARGSRPRVKLIDFGLCLPSGDARVLSRSGWVLGTPEYMAPEQAEGKSSSDPRVDLYAAGAVLHEAVTGARGREPSAARRFALRDPRDARIPSALQDVLVTALADEQSERFASAKDFHDALSAVEDELARAPVSSSIIVPKHAVAADASDFAVVRCA